MMILLDRNRQTRSQSSTISRNMIETYRNQWKTSISWLRFEALKRVEELKQQLERLKASGEQLKRLGLGELTVDRVDSQTKILMENL